MVAVTVATRPAGLLTDVTLTGLTVGTRYDVLRRVYEYVGVDDVGAPVYTLPLPDRRTNWQSVAHRVGWEAPAATATFRDYEPPIRPFAYFVVESTKTGPTDWDFKDGDYPLSRGVLGPTIVHIQRQLDEMGPASVVIRSTVGLADWTLTCIQDVPSTKYTARGTEFPIIGRQFPLYVADTREARRGTIVFVTDSLAQYEDLRRILYPESGRLAPVVFDAIGEHALLLDDMTVVPLDVTVEQASRSNPNLRFITADYVEISPTNPMDQRAGDNDSLTTAPNANFTISDNTPAAGQWVTLTDVSTGQYDHWAWSVGRSSNEFSRYYSIGPHRVSWPNRGKKTVKLRVSGPAGADVIVKTFTVH